MGLGRLGLKSFGPYYDFIILNEGREIGGILARLDLKCLNATRD